MIEISTPFRIVSAKILFSHKQMQCSEIVLDLLRYTLKLMLYLAYNSTAIFATGVEQCETLEDIRLT